MKKILFFAAVMGVAFTSCMNEEFIGDNSPTTSQGTPGAIGFGSATPAITRADKEGSAAATDLSNQFIVWGEKNETAANVGTAAGASGRDGDLVFKNYVVDWVTNSAYTTTSNTKDWEYVGLKLNDATASPATTTYDGNVTPNTGTDAQTIKYWDYGASSYTFTAVSALPADITAGYVKITKTQTGSSVYDKGYSVVLTANAHLDNLYFSERQSITDKSQHDRTLANKYGGNVTFRFHNMATKVRVGMYEIIPGYTVTINKFTVADDQADPTFAQMDDNVTANFAANLQNCASGTAGTLTVKYVSSGTTENHPTVSFTGTKAKVLNLGTGLSANVTIGESATGATFDKTGKAFTSVFPNEGNTQNLKLKVSYTLTDSKTGETIAVNDKTAEIPANYLKWKPGYAYTYLFKITDDDLYPITFDAVEVVAEDGSAEYITTVSEPSITTFGVKDSKYSVGKNEYENGTDIYATCVAGSMVQTPSLSESTKANYVQIYQVTTSDATNFPITEASVAERLAETPAGTAKITCTNVTNSTSTDYFADGTAPAVVDAVPAEDGTTKTIKALKLDNVKTNTYAIEYVTYDEGTTLAGSTPVKGYYTLSSTSYSKCGDSDVADGSTKYYKQIRTYKIIKVVAGS